MGEVLYHLPKAGEPSGRVEYVDAVPQTLALAGETEVAVARKTLRHYVSLDDAGQLLGASAQAASTLAQSALRSRSLQQPRHRLGTCTPPSFAQEHLLLPADEVPGGVEGLFAEEALGKVMAVKWHCLNGSSSSA